MIRAGLGLSVFLATGIAIAAGCTGEDPVLTGAAPEAGAPVPSDDGGGADGAVVPVSDAGAGADAQPMRISIAGKIITNYSTIAEDGLFVPLSGPAVSVYIAGKKVASIATGGTFAMNDVAIPYDAFVIETNASFGTRVWGYLGLTRPDPVLFGGVGGTSTSEAYATGTLNPAPTSGQLALIAIGGEGTDGLVGQTNTATYSQGHVRWASNPAPQVQAAAYVASFDATGQFPTSFSAYGVTAPYVPVAGGATAVKDILLNQVFNSQVHVAINLPPTFTISNRIIAYQPAGGPTFRVDTIDPTPTTLDFAVPSNASGEVRITALPPGSGAATSDFVQHVVRPLAMGSQTVTVPSITSRITAPTLGTIAAGTPIAWSTTPNAVYRFLMFPSSATSSGFTTDSLVVYLNTSSSGAPMPDLTKLGVTLPPGKYTATISALAPFGSLDAVCGPDVNTAFQTRTNAAGITLTAP